MDGFEWTGVSGGEWVEGNQWRESVDGVQAGGPKLRASAASLSRMRLRVLSSASLKALPRPSSSARCGLLALARA